MNEDKLKQAEQTLEALYQALLAEQAAVAKLNPTALALARADKEQLAADLQALGALDTNGDKKRAAALRTLATKVAHQARANALLLKHATQTLSTKLGIQKPMAATYDRRARMYSHRSSLMGQVF